MTTRTGAVQKALRQSKYGNKGAVVDNIKFSSKKEALRYQELTYLKKAGIVKEFVLQPRYEFQPAYWKCCGEVSTNVASKHICPYCNEPIKKVQSLTYVGDFLVTYADGHQELEDVKGQFMTDVFLIKQKIFEKRYPDLTIKLVTNVKGAR